MGLLLLRSLSKEKGREESHQHNTNRNLCFADGGDLERKKKLKNEERKRVSSVSKELLRLLFVVVVVFSFLLYSETKTKHTKKKKRKLILFFVGRETREWGASLQAFVASCLLTCFLRSCPDVPYRFFTEWFLAHGREGEVQVSNSR